ncbi:hypothetical protein Hanom_Chr02g00143911 [Helianthus anomalus]
MKRSYHTRLLLDVLRVYEAAEGLVLLSRLPPCVAALEKDLIQPAFPVAVDSVCKVPQRTGVADDVRIVLDADSLIARFPMLRKKECQLVYRRRKSRRCEQVSVVDEGSGAG